ncbi:MAG: hypothetical protein U5K69_06985 [Balneolaceae bacterium]|nr:hypothetical protein [Balneolaceae bacterium]
MWGLLICLILAGSVGTEAYAQDKIDLYSDARVQELNLERPSSELLKKQVTLKFDQISVEKLLAYLEQEKNIQFSYEKELLADNPGLL